MKHQREIVYMPRWLFSHVERGRISPIEGVFYHLILIGADIETGIWEGRAEDLKLPRVSLPRVRVILDSLVSKGYLRRVPTGYQFTKFERNEDGDLLVMEPELRQ